MSICDMVKIIDAFDACISVWDSFCPAAFDWGPSLKILDWFMAERVKKAKKPDVEVHQGSILIKRYSNRKLYDTSRSCYVTLEEVAAMVRNGQDVVIIDNKTKEDLTTVTLTQIIFEEEKKKSVIKFFYIFKFDNVFENW